MSQPDSDEIMDAKRAVMASRQFKAAMDDLADDTGRTLSDLTAHAAGCLDEMVADVSPRALRAWDGLGRWLTRSYTVDVDASALPQLAELSRRHSLVFLPNHRSYLDPLVLRTALSKHQFPGNYTLGGINLAMWPVSELGRRSGLIFIRRTAKGDPVYPVTLRLYLGYLLRQHANLEWYFEGGRTRTGKLRPPKMGVLRYLVDAFVANGDGEDDVYLVPVSVVYDQQAEVAALSREESGASKTPESIGWLVNFARAQSRGRGRAHLRFGEPLSLRQAMAEAQERAASVELTELVPRVAFEVAHRINAATPITPSALVMFGLLDNDGRAMTLAETLELLEPLLDYVRARGLPITSEVNLGRPEGLRKALATLVREGVVEEYNGGLETVYTIAPTRQHEAGFYRNTVTHYFITHAIVEIAAMQCSDLTDDDVAPALWERALALRDLLKYEFFFATKREFDADLRAAVAASIPSWSGDTISGAELADHLATSPLLLAHRVVGPFLEAYYVVADRLATAEPAAPVDKVALVAESLGVAKQRWLQHELHSPESISQDLLKGALQLADNRGLLRTGGNELIAERRAFAEEIAEAVRAVREVRCLALEKTSIEVTEVCDV